MKSVYNNIKNGTLILTRGMTRAEAYNYICGKDWGDVSTPSLYRKALDYFPKGSKILEVGIGTGMCLSENSDIIKQKNLNIVGIDIDDEYIQKCKQTIQEAGLSDFCSAETKDLFDVEDKFDYVFFMESYPVIPREIMKNMLFKAQSLTHVTFGNLVLVHNLCDSGGVLWKVIKRNLKYVVGADFGRVTSTKDWESFLKEMQFESRTKKMLISLHKESYPESHYNTWYGILWDVLGPQKNNAQYLFEIGKKHNV